MGLFIISGTMGGGKSYYAAELAAECWAAGGYVHSNIPWNPDELERRGWAGRHIDCPKDTSKWVTKVQTDDGEVLQSDWIRGGAEGQENLIIIDEAALTFHAYDQAENRKKNRCIFELVVMSRQIGVDMYFISQAATNIDAAIRKVSESVIRCINVRRIPGLGPLLAPFVGSFRRVWTQPEKGGELMACFARFKPSIGALYKTHGVGDKINVQRDPSRAVQKPKVSLTVWLFILGVSGLFAFSIYLGAKSPKAFKNYSSLADGKSLEDNPTSKPVSSSSVAATAVVSVAQPYLVARVENPLTLYDSVGRVFSMNRRPGVRVVKFLFEEEEHFTVELFTGTTIVLQKSPK